MSVVVCRLLVVRPAHVPAVGDRCCKRRAQIVAGGVFSFDVGGRRQECRHAQIGRCWCASV